MLKYSFKGYLWSSKDVYQDDDALKRISIRHVSHGDNQMFLEDLQSQLRIENVVKLFETPVFWKKMVIDTTTYPDMTFDILFDEFNFKADLVQIGISRKFKNGSEVFEYILTFDKDMEEGDSAHVKSYLKAKEEDPQTGKKTLIDYEIEINPAVEEKKEPKDELL